MERVRGWASERTEEQLAYVLAGLLLVGCAASHALAKLLRLTEPSWLWLVPPGVLLYGLLHHVVGRLKAAAHSTATKAAWVVGMAVAVPVARSAASNLVNYALQVPSAAFPNTTLLVALLLSPIAVITVAVLISMPPMMIWLWEERAPSIKLLLGSPKRPKKSPAEEATLLVRGVAFLGAWILLLSILFNVGPYAETVGKFAQNFSYKFETEKFSHCAKADNEFVAYLDGDWIVLASSNSDEVKFRTAKCVASGESLSPERP